MNNLDVIERNGIYILKPMEKLMKMVIEKNNDRQRFFTDEVLGRLNKKLKKNNIYMYDRYGLIIRGQERNNKRSLTGYKVNPNDGSYEHILINQLDVDFNKDILGKVLKEIKRKLNKRQILWKVYAELYPEIWDKIEF
jgi:cytidylate kinase